jgi:hypothetical protein
MSDYLRAVLDELVPTFADERSDWEGILRDAGLGEHASVAIGVPEHERTRWTPPHRLLVIAVLVAVIAIPLVAVAAAHEWWFFRFGQDFPPVTSVKVVKTGVWDGTEWEFLAYLSSTDGVCYGISPIATARTTGQGGALACDQIEGVPRTETSKAYTPHTITYMAGFSDEVPTHIVGAVVKSADEVAVYLSHGRVVRTVTFTAPGGLGAIRFFATRLPGFPIRSDQPPRIPIRKLVGLDGAGNIVACLVVPMPPEGVPLSAC